MTYTLTTVFPFSKYAKHNLRNAKLIVFQNHFSCTDNKVSNEERHSLILIKLAAESTKSNQ